MQISECKTRDGKTKVSEVNPANTKTLTYVYLLSAAHSGSTLLACLLGSHSDISSVGEFGSTFNPDLKCSCGKSFAECCFWNDLRKRASAAGFDFQIGRPEINLEPSGSGGFFEDLFYYRFHWQWLNRLREVLYRVGSSLPRRADMAVDKSIWLARDICRHEQSHTFVDTGKNPYQIGFLAKRNDIDLKVIALVRDGRAVMNSMIEKEGWAPQQAIDSWLWANRQLNMAVKGLPEDKVFHLRLEKFCEQPDQILKQLLRFCNGDDQESLDAYIPGNRHVIGNGMRLRFDGKIKLDAKWLTSLSDENLELFESQAGSVNRMLGYSSGRTRPQTTDTASCSAQP